MSQDFNKRLSIVIRNDIPTWQALNAASHIAAYFGNQMKEAFGTGEYFHTQDQFQVPRNSQYPFIILSADPRELKRFADSLDKRDVHSMYFIKEMIETTNDTEIESLVQSQNKEDLEYLGIGLFGDHEKIRPATRRFGLWK